MDNITLTGIDLSKSVFEVRSENHAGRLLRRAVVSRKKLMEVISQLPQGSEIAMEACGSSHYWHRRFSEIGLKAKLISPQYVTPFRKSQKNDKNDAEAICEAARRPNMRFVAAKTKEQLEMQALHRIRERLVKHRTALINQVRGLLLEEGIEINRSVSQFKKRIPELIQDRKDDSLSSFILNELWREFLEGESRLKDFTDKITKVARNNSQCRRIMNEDGVGPIIATAVVAHMGSARNFKNGRCYAASLGLVPRQFSTGGVTKLGSITKRGDRYIRKLLVHGARSVVRYARLNETPDQKSLWIRELYKRCGYNRTAVALANKLARQLWAILANKEPIQKPLPLAA